MPRPLQLSGDDVITILAKFGPAVHSQHGSHAKLRRVTNEGIKQTLTIPRHKELDPRNCRLRNFSFGKSAA